MNIDFRARLTGSILVGIGLAWYFATDKRSMTALIPVVPGLVLYAAGLLGTASKIKQSTGYLVLLLIIGGISILSGFAGIFELFKGTMGIAALAELVTFIGVLSWFCQYPLSVIRSPKESSKSSE
jgi:predicted ABC-type sugar transport system permease subunit